MINIINNRYAYIIQIVYFSNLNLLKQIYKIPFLKVHEMVCTFMNRDKFGNFSRWGFCHHYLCK